MALKQLVGWLLSVWLLAACATTSPAPTAEPSPLPANTADQPSVTDEPPPTEPAATLAAAPELELPDGFQASIYAAGLVGPSAMAFGPDGALYITQLGGGENAGAGQIARVAQPGAAPEILLEDLFKPTGLVWRGDTLWIVAGRDILRTSMDDNTMLAPPETVLTDLPYNGRSNGQITLLPDNRLIFEASGSVRNPDSGVLLVLDPETSNTPAVLASGLKGAYDHAVDPATGTIYTVEIGDDRMNGQAPPEEINVIEAGADYGWPVCYADQQPARDRGGTPERCATTAPPLVLFEPGATMTGLEYYTGADFPPDYRNVLYTALWNGDPPHVARVMLSEAAGRIAGSAEPFVQGLGRPMDVLTDPTGGLLVLDYERGTVYRVTAE
ncbi:MAG: glucose sorbosone dehydrogenase [Chloroflexaceae bacterium]|nr:glucose sorbosone dehydrogenase [Chloroflexaceae bacterium]